MDLLLVVVPFNDRTASSIRVHIRHRDGAVKLNFSLRPLSGKVQGCSSVQSSEVYTEAQVAFISCLVAIMVLDFGRVMKPAWPDLTRRSRPGQVDPQVLLRAPSAL
jgi:hypothetical protein